MCYGTYYRRDVDPQTLYQGDILTNFPVTILPRSLRIVRRQQKLEEYSEARVYEQARLDDAFSNGKEAVIVEAILMLVMILSQTCDIQSREFIAVSPVFPLDNIDDRNHKEAIRNAKVLYRFHLPANDDMAESYLDINLINSVPGGNLRIEDRIVSLTDNFRQHLNHFIYNYFNRPFMP